MINLRFNRLPRHRKYSYQPIYYNEEKEKLDAQVKRIKKITEDEQGQSREERMREGFKFKSGKDRYQAAGSRFYGLRILLIASILGLLFFKLLNSHALEFIFEGLSK